jgi:hypothetical protein
LHSNCHCPPSSDNHGFRSSPGMETFAVMYFRVSSRVRWWALARTDQGAKFWRWIRQKICFKTTRACAS